jgi:hypothetical protein
MTKGVIYGLILWLAMAGVAVATYKDKPWVVAGIVLATGLFFYMEVRHYDGQDD